MAATVLENMSAHVQVLLSRIRSMTRLCCKGLIFLSPGPAGRRVEVEDLGMATVSQSAVSARVLNAKLKSQDQHEALRPLSGACGQNSGGKVTALPWAWAPPLLSQEMDLDHPEM